MSATFFKSENVNIFPCARRGNYTEGGTNKTYNAESRFVSEANLTKLSGLAFGRDSYIISRPATASEEGIWKLVIKGYYFEIGVEENELQSEGYFIIGLEDTSGIPRIRLAALTESSDSLGINKGAASLDAEGRCRAICFISLDGEPSRDALYHVYSEDTLENLDKSYFFEGARKEENDLTTLLKIQNGIDLINAKFGEEYSSENTVAQAISGVRGLESDETTAYTVYGARAYAKALFDQLSGSNTGEEAPKTLPEEITARQNADTQIRTDFAAADTTTLAEAKGYADTKRDEVIGDANSTKDSNTVKGAKLFASDVAATAKSEAISAAASDATSKADAAEANAKAHADALASAAETTAKSYADSQDDVLKTAIVGGDTDTSSADTIAGAKKYADERFAALAGQGGETGDPVSLTAEIAARIEADNDLMERLEKVEAFFETTDGETFNTALDTLVEIQDYLDGDGSAAGDVISRVGTAEAAIAALSTEIEGLNAEFKEDGSVTAAQNEIAAAQGEIAALKTADEEINEGLGKKLDTETFNSLKSTHETGHAKPANEITSEITDAVNGEKSAREAADAAINEKIGSSYSKTATVEMAIAAATSDIVNLQETVSTCLLKKDVEGNKLGIYAVAFDLSGNLEELSSDFKAATSRPIVFISECSTLPSPPEGYAWFDSPNEDAQEVKTINTNIILYLKKINSPEEEKDPEDTPVE